MWYISASMRLPSNNLEFRVIGSKDSTFFEITLFDKSKTKNQGLKLFQDTSEPYACIGIIRISKMPASEHGDFFVSMGAHAVKGYGPLLYDKAIEVASSLGCKLINHATEFYLTHKDKTRKMTSPEAFQVWNKYKERKDVKNHDLGDGYFALSKEPNQKYFYE